MIELMNKAQVIDLFEREAVLFGADDANAENLPPSPGVLGQNKKPAWTGRKETER